MAPSRYDWKIVDWDVKPQHNQPTPLYYLTLPSPLPSSPLLPGERGGSVVECRTPEREVRGSRPTAAVLCPWARHFIPRKYWLITQEAMAPSRHHWKIVDWDVKPQHNQKPLLPHYITLPFPTPFPTLSSHLLYSPTIPSPPFNPQLTYPTLQSPTPMPLISSLGYPTLLSHPYPTIFSPLLPFPRIPSPTYLPYLTPLSYSCIPYPLLPLIPYPTISLRTL